MVPCRKLSLVLVYGGWLTLEHCCCDHDMWDSLWSFVTGCFGTYKNLILFKMQSMIKIFFQKNIAVLRFLFLNLLKNIKWYISLLKFQSLLDLARWFMGDCVWNVWVEFKSFIQISNGLTFHFQISCVPIFSFLHISVKVYFSMFTKLQETSNGSWCMGIKGEMSGTVCVTFTWYMYIYEVFIAFVCFVVCSLL